MSEVRKLIETVPGLIGVKVVLVASLALAVTEISIVTNADVAVADQINSETTGWLTAAVLAISDMASTPAITLATVVIVAALAAGRHWHGAAALAISVVGTQVAVSGVKLLIARPRPHSEQTIVDPSGFSFPSAHSASAMALYLTVALIAAGLLKRRFRFAPYVAAGFAVALVGISRVYLGAHYPTDVLAGWLTGGIAVAASWHLCSRLPAAPPARL
jgi:undecaprenyl-diphosphatase